MKEKTMKMFSVLKYSLIAALLILPNMGNAVEESPEAIDSKKLKELEQLIENIETEIPNQVVIYELYMENGKVEVYTEDGESYTFLLKEGQTTLPPIPGMAPIVIPEIDIKLPDKIGDAIAPAKGIKTGDILKLGQDVIVEEAEEVYGSITVVSGDIIVRGRVEGDVTSVNGDVLVASTGKVFGNVSAFGGTVERESGSVVTGEKVEATAYGLRKPHISFPFSAVFFALIVLVFSLTAVTVAPKNVAKVQKAIESNVFKTFFLGYLFIMALPLAMLILVITVVGIPVAGIAVPVLTAAAIIMGFSALSNIVGARFLEITRSPEKSKVINVLIGGALMFALLIVGVLFDSIFGIFGSISNIFKIIGIVILCCIVLPISFGASVLTVLGTRPRESQGKSGEIKAVFRVE
ncbi:MAG: hypothetical protein GF307_12350 [candidate division Zixibacteria bacterium]|nr:hypothetical protein [candidate division Zixibacteria bacterium]